MSTIVEITASTMAWVQICNPAASARIMRSRISEIGCISSESRPRFPGWSEKGSKKYAVADPSEPSAYAFTAPIRRYGPPNARRTPIITQVDDQVKIGGRRAFGGPYLRIGARRF